MPFHISLPCNHIGDTKRFYMEKVGASLGREGSNWVDIDLYGNQITFTRSGDFDFSFKSYKLEDKVLPSFHFGIIVDKKDWLELYARLSEGVSGFSSEITFMSSKIGEHRSFFVSDPNGYSLEFKCFSKPKEIFSK